MWIRSQDKKVLIDARVLQIGTVVNVLIEPDTNTRIERADTFKVWTDSDNYECTLGEYTTEERVLEVLDEIHDQLINATKCDIIVNGERITKLAVYQMPKE